MTFHMHKSKATESILVDAGVTLIDTTAIAALYDAGSAQDMIARIEAAALGTECAARGLTLDHTISRWWRMAKSAGWSASCYQAIVADAYYDACADRGICAWTHGTAHTLEAAS